MKKYGTDFLESEALFAAQENDRDYLMQVLAEMSDDSRSRLREAAQYLASAARNHRFGSDETPREGWVGVMNSRKWHYVVGTDALCGMVIFGGEAEPGNDDSPDNCATCKKKLAKRKARLATQQ